MNIKRKSFNTLTVLILMVGLLSPALPALSPVQADNSFTVPGSSSASVIHAECTTVNLRYGVNGYLGARDTEIRENDPDFNFGALATYLLVDSDHPDLSGKDVSALLYWDLTSIPAGSTVHSASITLYIDGVTVAPGFDLFEMTQAWTEGTGVGTESNDGATWNTYDGANPWPGGAGGAADRGTTSLANFTPEVEGAYTADLNADGLSVLENWISNADANNGFMIHAGANYNGMYFRPKERIYESQRPMLTICYTLPPEPVTVTVMPGQSKIYGEQDPVFAFTYEPSDPPIDFNGSLSREPGEDVGTYIITLGNLTADGYVITLVPADFSINAKAASVTPDNASKYTGEADPVLTGTLSGFLPADNVTAEYVREIGEDIGVYEINAQLSPASVLGNYDITYNKGVFTILEKPTFHVFLPVVNK